MQKQENFVWRQPRQCAQCSTVGFNCETSGAFPSGYTESLVANLEAFEAEWRELKDLSDDMDERDDVLL